MVGGLRETLAMARDPTVRYIQMTGVGFKFSANLFKVKTAVA